MLYALNGALLRECHCLFGGGTAIALYYDEYRESEDIDFLVSNLAGYRNLRQLLNSPQGIAAIVRSDSTPLRQAREIRADQYGIRTVLLVAEQSIKFEIVLEGRIDLLAPGAQDAICGIATLTPLDMVASKLLANSDRWGDDSVFSRDLIDLAMMTPTLGLFRQAVEKAEQAYGKSILQDLQKAIHRIQQRDGWLERCMHVLSIDLPSALLWQRIRSLKRLNKRVIGSAG